MIGDELIEDVDNIDANEAKEKALADGKDFAAICLYFTPCRGVTSYCWMAISRG